MQLPFIFNESVVVSVPIFSGTTCICIIGSKRVIYLYLYSPHHLLIIIQTFSFNSVNHQCELRIQNSLRFYREYLILLIKNVITVLFVVTKDRILLNNLNANFIHRYHEHHWLLYHWFYFLISTIWFAPLKLHYENSKEQAV